MKSLRTVCVRHTTMYQFTVSFYSKSHTQGACVFSWNSYHLHFCQNDRDLLRATAVTRAWGWNGYRNKRQHRKLTLEKNVSLCSCRGLESEILYLQVSRSTTELSPMNVKGSNTTNYAQAKVLSNYKQ